MEDEGKISVRSEAVPPAGFRELVGMLEDASGIPKRDMYWQPRGPEDKGTVYVLFHEWTERKQISQKKVEQRRREQEDTLFL